MNKEAFDEAIKKVVGVEKQQAGIGTLSEKTTHRVLKYYYDPDENHHEIPLEGYVADIYKDGMVIEIQTRQMDKMRKKLSAFLEKHPVTVVYPIPKEKYLIWIDEETGELSNKRKSPIKGNPYMVFPELYKIKMYLKNPNISFRLPLINMEEYRLLNGWSKNKKRGSHRYDRIPIGLDSEFILKEKEDYRKLVPFEEGEDFTVKQFAKKASINARLAQITINIMYYMDVITRVGKNRNAYLYTVLNKNDED